MSAANKNMLVDLNATNPAEESSNNSLRGDNADTKAQAKFAMGAAIYLKSNYAKRNHVDYTVSDIIRISRQLLLEDDPDNVFDLSSIQNAKQKQQRKLEQRLPSILSKIIKCQQTTIPYSIWRCCLLNEADFNKLLPILQIASTNAKLFSKVITTFNRRHNGTLKLVNEISAETSTKEIFEKLSKIDGSDWQVLLKNKESYSFEKNDEKQKKFIFGGLEVENKVMETFLKSKTAKLVSNKKRYPTIKARQKFLQQKFQKFLRMKKSAKRSSESDESTVEPPSKKRKLSYKAESESKCTNIQCKKLDGENKLIENMIPCLNDEMTAAVAAIIQQVSCCKCKTAQKVFKVDGNFITNGILDEEKILQNVY